MPGFKGEGDEGHEAEGEPFPEDELICWRSCRREKQLLDLPSLGHFAGEVAAVGPVSMEVT